MNEIFVILVSATVIGLLVFIALTLNSISCDLFKIRQILKHFLKNYEYESTELLKS